jgi:hypothetical protein
MLSLDDKRWKEFEGGYRGKYNASIVLSKLESGKEDPAQIWSELWENLHHQGDVGIASYASVPHIARIIRKRRLFDWNPVALIVVIELARGKGDNPEVPDWLQSDYDLALKDVARYGLENLEEEWDTETLKSFLGLLSIIKGNRDLGELIFEVDTDDAKDLLDKYFDG